MIRIFRLLPLVSFLAVALVAVAQQQDQANAAAAVAPDDAVANPARPTVSTPATLTPTGYFQFETGFLAAWHAPEVSYQGSFNEVIKFSVSRWIELLVESEPYAHSHAPMDPRMARETSISGFRELSITGRAQCRRLR